MNQINPPFPVFTDVDGNPLENGYVFVGQENLYSETAPIQIYWDADLTIPATQPLRTSGGYLMRNGSPAMVFCNSAYSILVRNKNKTDVYYLASSTVTQYDLAYQQAQIATAQANSAAASAASALAQAQAASAYVVTAGSYASSAQAASALAQAARDAAVIGAPNVFATTADGLSSGVINTTGLVAGSAGTNGTFDLAFSGGGGTNAAGRFVVSGGAVTQITITNPGTGYTSAPTVSFAASAGLTGASVTAVIGRRVNTGGYFSVPSSDSNESMILYRADAGPVATEIKRYPSAALLTWTNEYRYTAGSNALTEKVVEPGTNTANSVYQNLTVATNDVVDVWLTVKANGRNTVNLYNNGGATMNVRIDLERGKIYNDNAGWALTSYDITPLGNGWYIVHIVKTVPAGGSGNLQFRLYGPPTGATPYGTATYAGDGASGAFVDSLLVYNRTTTTYPFASSRLSAASWTKLGSTVAAATVTNNYTLGGAVANLQAVVGEYQLGLGSSYTSKRFTEQSGSVSPSLYNSYAFTNSVVYTISVVAKAAERTKLNFYCNGGILPNVTFDMATEVITGVNSTNKLKFTRLGGGWYLVALVATATQTATANLQIRMLDAAGNSTYTGDGVSGMYVDSVTVSTSSVDSCFKSTNPLDASWTKAGITVAQTAVASSTGATRLANLAKYFGDSTGDKFVEASGAAVNPSVYRSYTFSSGTAYTFGGYFKAGERYRVNLYCNGGALFSATFNLQSGVVESGANATITSVGGGWYKCEQTVTATASTAANLQMRVYPAGSGQPYAGDGNSGLYCNDAYLTAGGGNLLTNSNDFGGGSWTLQDVIVLTDVMPYGGPGLTTPYVDPGAARLSGKKVAVIGTSITAQAQYTVPLAAELGLVLTNLGTSGGSIAQNGHYGSLYIYNAISSIPTNSDIVLVEAGTNDFGVSTPSTLGALGDTTTATFYGALYAAVVAIRARAPSAKIVFFTQYSADSRVPAYAIGYVNPNGNKIQQFQQAVEDVAGYCGYASIDVGREAGLGYFTGTTFFGDGLHLNATGGAKFASYVAEKLRILARGNYFN